MFGATTGAAYGSKPRFGPDLTYLVGKCKDACTGAGPIIGVINPVTREYFGGGAIGFFYMGSAWIDVAARYREQKLTGYHMSLAFGYIGMMYVAVGVNKPSSTSFGELGFTIKAPKFF